VGEVGANERWERDLLVLVSIVNPRFVCDKKQGHDSVNPAKNVDKRKRDVRSYVRLLELFLDLRISEPERIALTTSRSSTLLRD
jgi:hypothetical protein